MLAPRSTLFLFMAVLLVGPYAYGQSCPVSGTFSGSISAADPVQTNRLSPNSTVSTCGGKPVPALTSVPVSGYRYDQYAFTNSTGAAACVRVTLTSACGNIHSAAYLGSFNPSNPQANYLGDLGYDYEANTIASYSFSVPAMSSFVVVVHSTNGGACGAYSVTLDCTNSAGAAAPLPGQVLINEFRLSGPGTGVLNERDEFIELYNNTDGPINIGGYRLGGHDPNFNLDFEAPAFPANTIIPARGYFLVADTTAYSLSGYAAALGLTARPNDNLAPFGGDFFIDNQGLQLVAPNDAVIDSVGFTGGGNSATYIEGTGLPQVSSRPAV